MLDEIPKLLDRRRLYLPSFDEIAAAFLDFTVTEYATIASCALWLVLLFMPIGDADRRDSMTGFTYMLYLTAAGVTLCLVIPHKLSTLDASPYQVVVTIGLAMLAGVRWSMRRRPPPKSVNVNAPVTPPKGTAK